jgi:hypothetical protein
MRWMNGMTYSLTSPDGALQTFTFMDGQPLPADAELVDTPASRGCLLALVRERFPDAYVAARRRIDGEPWFVLVSGDDLHLGHIEGGSEFDVLLNALSGELQHGALQLRVRADALARVGGTYLDMCTRGAVTDVEYARSRADTLLQEAARLYERYRASATVTTAQLT